MFVGAKQVSTSTTAAVSRATKMMASWILALAFACLIQPATGFVGNPGLRSRETWRRASCDHPSSKGRPARRVVAAGVGGLRAAFEVDEGRELDVGSVLVAGSDNYGHMTFKVRTLWRTGRSCALSSCGDTYLLPERGRLFQRQRHTRAIFCRPKEEGAVSTPTSNNFATCPTDLPAKWQRVIPLRR